MKRLKIWLLFFPILIAAISACHKDNELNPEDPWQNLGILERSETEVNELMDELALNLATNIKHPSIQDVLISNAITQFDGDDNFLALKEFSQTFTFVEDSNRMATIGELLLHGAFADTAHPDSLFALEAQLSANLPLLNIYIPEWSRDTLTQEFLDSDSILVAYVPKEDSLQSVPAYDSRGNLHYLNADSIPSRPVVVLNENERVYTLSNTSGTPQYDGHEINQPPFFSTSTHDFFLKSRVHDEINWEVLGLICGTCPPPLNPPTGGGPSGGGSGEGDCDRDVNDEKDQLLKMKFKTLADLKRVEPWKRGGPEMKVTIAFGKANGSLTQLTKIVAGPRRDFRVRLGFRPNKTIWKQIDAEVVTWDKSTYGDVMLYNWLEMNNGDETEFTTTLSSEFEDENGNSFEVGFDITIKSTDEDESLGQSLPEYCDKTSGEGRDYDPSTHIIFHINQEQ